MPRAKSDTVKTSVELDAEIQEMQKKLAEKKKAAQAAKRREKAEADRARAIEEAEFNKQFVAVAKEIPLCNCPHDGRTIYEHIREIIRLSAEENNEDDVPPEPVQVPGDAGRHTDPMEGSILRPFGTHTA